MSEIHRYDPSLVFISGENRAELELKVDGECVLFTDHQAAIAERDAKIAKLDELNRLQSEKLKVTRYEIADLESKLADRDSQIEKLEQQEQLVADAIPNNFEGSEDTLGCIVTTIVTERDRVLKELADRDEKLKSIANDFFPTCDDETALALSEMRQAILALTTQPKEGTTP